MSRSTLQAGALALGLLAGPVLAAPAGAQQITSPYDFVETAQGARAFVSYIAADRGVIDVGPASGMAAGIGYTIRISGPFEFDTKVSFLPTTRRVFNIDTSVDSATLRNDPTAGLEELGEADLSLLILDATLRFDLTGPRTWYNLQPYAMIGAGGVFTVASDNEAEDNLPTDVELRVRFGNGFTGHLGAGVEWHAFRSLTLRADVRDRLWRIEVPAGFFQPGRLIDDAEWVQTADLSLGLVWRF